MVQVCVSMSRNEVSLSINDALSAFATFLWFRFFCGCVWVQKRALKLLFIYIIYMSMKKMQEKNKTRLSALPSLTSSCKDLLRCAKTPHTHWPICSTAVRWRCNLRRAGLQQSCQSKSTTRFMSSDSLQEFFIIQTNHRRGGRGEGGALLCSI